VATDDDAAKATALDELAGYREDFAAFLDSATSGNAPAGPVADALQSHVDQLVAALDAYAAGDFEAAYAAEREASAHMFMTGEVLAAAIAGQFPDRFPTGPIPSDTAMAAPVSVTTPLALIGLAVSLLVGLAVTRRAIEVRTRD
jgi:hypothetical protein